MFILFLDQTEPSKNNRVRVAGTKTKRTLHHDTISERKRIQGNKEENKTKRKLKERRCDRKLFRTN